MKGEMRTTRIEMKFDKQAVVLSLADESKLAAILVELGFFKPQLILRCPARSTSSTYGDRCEKKREEPLEGPCVWSWQKVGNNPECPLDAELKQSCDRARAEAADLKGTVAKAMKFTLSEICGGHSIDIAVEIPEEIKVSEYFRVLHNGPTKYFLVFDLGLKDILKAIRYVRLILSIPGRVPKPQPIIVTYAERGVDLIEKQGLRVYRLKEGEPGSSNVER